MRELELANKLEAVLEDMTFLLSKKGVKIPTTWGELRKKEPALVTEDERMAARLCEAWGALDAARDLTRERDRLLELLTQASVKLDAYHCDGQIMGPDADLFMRIQTETKGQPMGQRGTP